ncbi:hypothetical protein SEVIR_1G365700v4 [Setaria viridis]
MSRPATTCSWWRRRGSATATPPSSTAPTTSPCPSCSTGPSGTSATAPPPGATPRTTRAGAPTATASTPSATATATAATAPRGTRETPTSTVDAEVHISSQRDMLITDFPCFACLSYPMMKLLLQTEDIDECNRKHEYSCYGDCTNKPGTYICECPPGTTGDHSRQNGCRPKDKFTLALKVVTGVSVGVFLSVFMCFWLYLGLQKRKLIRTKQRFFEQNGGVILQQQMRSYSSAGAGAGGFKIFSEEELEKATNNFADDRVLGRGGHGVVYRGVLEDKTVVAIKKSKMMEEAQTKEFAREMFILSQINHRNVVKLLGCCLEVEVPMLVYEFVSSGTLYHYIHKDLKADKTFDTRLRIAAESAEALAYMHSSASPPILHGDVKTANILLDDKLTAKVSDFGASKLAPTDEAEIATLVQGTCGYLDPEYLMTCQLTDKSDVYSFGVVLLELLTRKKALYFDGPEEDRSLVSCFMTAMKAGRHEELLDNQVRNEMRAEVLEEIAHLVMRCLSMSGEERPTMKEVAERLRRYQQHPWAQAHANPEERQTLLPREQQDLPLLFRQQDVLDLEEGSTYTYSL